MTISLLPVHPCLQLYDTARAASPERSRMRVGLLYLIDKIASYHGMLEGSETLKVIYHRLYSMNKFVTNISKLPQDGAQVFPYMG